MSGLPVEDCVADLRAALARPEPGAAVLQAPPGAGKTTVVPLRLLDEPWLAGRRIVVLEPRRLAARAAATRMAAQLGEPVGQTVGYATRDQRIVGPSTRIEVLTEGILTRRLQKDRSLPGTGLVVFDEVHERNLHTDLALALVLAARSSARPGLRLLAMSATMDPAPLAALLGGAPVVASDGRQHPVEVRWLPPPPRQKLDEAAANAVRRALRGGEGDVLVFLPGAADIRRVERRLAADGVDVRPLFGALPVAEQDLALAPSPPGRRRVVLATDIAESSLTVEGVRQVVDSGQARTPRYDARSGLTRLHTGPISRASADQRAGRAGRVAPGTAYRLWSKMEHAARRPFAPPEIASVDLAGLVLELAAWGARPDELAFLDPPPRRALDEGRALLVDLGALDGSGRPTAEGRAMVDLPLHPRLARMVTGARPVGRGWEACVLAALLEDRDVLRGRPDELPVDVYERVRLIADRRAHHPAAEGPAVAAARRRALDLARRAAVETRDVAAAALGPVLALGYPDRVAQARTGGRFRLRNGAGAWVPRADPLAGEAFLVVAELDADRRDSRVRMAAPLEPAEVERAAEVEAAVGWDDRRDDLRATRTRRSGSLVLAEDGRPVAAGAAATGALVEQVRARRLGLLGWTARARGVQQRVAFLRARFGESWPDLSDAALLADLDAWLPRLLTGARRRADVEAIDMAGVLRAMLGPDRAAELDRLAPESVTTDSGRRLAIDYASGAPAASAAVQDLFGCRRHPTVAAGQVPVVLRLLSPARRPVQITTDLPGFWAGSYAAVRREMAGRYPRHPWPADPAAAEPPGPRRRRP